MRRSLLPILALPLCMWGCGNNSAQAGGDAPDFRLTSLEDAAKQVTQQDFKGKTVLIDFWATWCGPCRDAMPEIQSLYDKYKSKGFDVVSVSQEDRDTVSNFHKGQSYTYPVYLDTDGTMGTRYAVEGLPTLLLVRDGKVLWKQVGYGDDGALTAAVTDALK